MLNNLPLDQMSVAEKLATMETLWADLCRNPDEVPSPQWHEKVLADRSARLDSGEATTTDWETVKARLRNLGK